MTSATLFHTDSPANRIQQRLASSLVSGSARMIGGFAFAAYPAYYGQTGIMTFMVNQQGHVCQKALGPKTASVAAKMKEFDPDSTWQPSGV